MKRLMIFAWQSFFYRKPLERPGAKDLRGVDRSCISISS
jgi:hypothetical protein